MRQEQVEQEQQGGWVSQVNRGLQMKRAGEQMAAAALRKRLDKVGEKQWLQECADEWGWSERTSYRHLNPEGMEQARQDTAERREPANNRQVAEPQAPVVHVEPVFDAHIPPPAEYSQTLLVAASIDSLVDSFNSTSLDTVMRVLREGKWGITKSENVIGALLLKVHAVIAVLSNLKSELEKELIDGK